MHPACKPWDARCVGAQTQVVKWTRARLYPKQVLLLLLALPFACLAVLSLVAFLGVAAIAGALHVIGTITSALGIAVRKNADPWHGAVGDAHALDYVEAQH